MRLCTDCKHFTPPHGALHDPHEYGKCKAPGNMGTSPVTGESVPTVAIFAVNVRAPGHEKDGCGPSAKWFEQKEQKA